MAVALAALIGAMGWVCLSTTILPLADYPNHMARLYIESHISTDTYLAQYYQLFWHFQPNLALDAIGAFLAPAFDIYTIGRLLGVATFASLAVGAVLLGHITVQWHSSNQRYADLLRLTPLLERGGDVTGITVSGSREYLTFPPLQEAASLFVYPENATSSPLMYRDPYHALLRRGHMISSTSQAWAQTAFGARLDQIAHNEVEHLLLIDDGRFDLAVPADYRVIGQTGDGLVRLFRICRLSVRWVAKGGCIGEAE